MFMMKNGTHSAMQSTSASATAVEISIAQLLPVPSIFRCKLWSWPRARLGRLPLAVGVRPDDNRPPNDEKTPPTPAMTRPQRVSVIVKPAPNDTASTSPRAVRPRLQSGTIPSASGKVQGVSSITMPPAYASARSISLLC
jgi:hypothetical protein